MDQIRGDFFLVISNIALRRHPHFHYYTFTDEDDDLLKAKVDVEFFPNAFVEGIVTLDDEILDRFDDFEDDFRAAFLDGELEIDVTMFVIKLAAIDETLKALGIPLCCPCCIRVGETTSRDAHFTFEH